MFAAPWTGAARRSNVPAHAGLHALAIAGIEFRCRRAPRRLHKTAFAEAAGDRAQAREPGFQLRRNALLMSEAIRAAPAFHLPGGYQTIRRHAAAQEHRRRRRMGAYLVNTLLPYVFRTGKSAVLDRSNGGSCAPCIGKRGTRS